MQQKGMLIWLVPLVILLSMVAAGFGLFWQPGYDPEPFLTLHGQEVDLAGRGIYSHDTIFSASTSRGTDFFILFIGIPLLIFSFLLYRRGLLRGGFLLTGVLSLFLYYGASLGLDKAYNNLFLVYIVLFSSSFYAVLLAFKSIDVDALPALVKDKMLWRRTAVFMIFVGTALAAIWLSDVVSSLMGNHVPTLLGPSTTMVTYTLDVGIISVACVAAGVLLFRRSAPGLMLSAVLNIMLVQIGGMVICQTVFELNAGVPLTPGELIGKSASFVVMAAAAAWLLILMFKNLSDPQKHRLENNHPRS